MRRYRRADFAAMAGELGLETWKPAWPSEMLGQAGLRFQGAGVSCLWVSRCQLNGPHDDGVAFLVEDALGSIHSFSHSIGNVEPWTTMRWKFGTS
jgi:hypothetical protein